MHWTRDVFAQCGWQFLLLITIIAIICILLLLLLPSRFTTMLATTLTDLFSRFALLKTLYLLLFGTLELHLGMAVFLGQKCSFNSSTVMSSGLGTFGDSSNCCLHFGGCPS